MWGLRAIRVVTVFAGVVTAVAGSGCKSWLCSGLGPTPNPRNLDSVPTEVISAGEAKEEAEALKNWRRPYWAKDQPSDLTPERIHGGIY